MSDDLSETSYEIFRFFAESFVRERIPDLSDVELDEYVYAIQEQREIDDFLAETLTTEGTLGFIGFNKTLLCAQVISPHFPVEEAFRESSSSLPELKIPENYADLYPEARKMKRHFILHVGPTNSGKTHQAVKCMEQYENGVYLAPLRLLAEEMQETIEKDGFTCSLLTGEEEIINEKAPFISSTAEMADLHHVYDCAVIDECQMCGDASRGGAWTAALLGLQAKTIHLCFAPQAREILISLIELCGDTYEIVEHQRKTPLTITNSIAFPDDIQKGDACIVFSRANVHAVGAVLQEQGLKVSTIYGALPADVRRKQAEDFASGKTDGVVATDAIGMGMNLPIKRIVFLEVEKFDGIKKRFLKDDEIKQIAGRAGRYGLFEEGLVTYADGKTKWLKNALNRPVKMIDKAVIGFPTSNGYDSLSASLKVWERTPVHNGFIKQDTKQLLSLAKKAEHYFDDYHQVLTLASMPFDAQNTTFLDIWHKGVKSLTQDKLEAFVLEEMSQFKSFKGDLQHCEFAYKKADLLYIFADRFHLSYEKVALCEIRKSISKEIIDLLSKTKLKPRRCRYCGKILPWNYPYGMCAKCHDNLYGSRFYNYYDEDDDYW
jgi:ATP-dependent RNA helicase SUPV3L1/SUV3